MPHVLCVAITVAGAGAHTLYEFAQDQAGNPEAWRAEPFTIDPTVPGAGEYSSMNVFAVLGYDVWTMDHENYGRSSRTSGNSDIASGVGDLVAATELVIRATGQERLHLMGESSGALRAAAFAVARPADCCDPELTADVRLPAEKTGADDSSKPLPVAVVAIAVDASVARRFVTAASAHDPAREGPPIILLKQSFLI